MIETLQKINKIVPNLTVSQLIELVNIIINYSLPHNGFITVDTNNIKTTSTENPFSVSSYL